MKKNIWLAMMLITVLCAPGCRNQECPVPAQRVMILKGDPYMKDVLITEYNPNQNRGEDERLIAGTWTFDGIPAPLRILFDFNLSSIPKGVEIEKAELILFSDTTMGIGSGFNGHQSLTESNKAHAKRITSAWDENIATWNIAPTFDDVNSVAIAESVSEEQTYTIDITQIVKDQKENPELYHGVMIQVDKETHYNALTFCSKEHRYANTLAPQLKITFKR